MFGKDILSGRMSMRFLYQDAEKDFPRVEKTPEWRKLAKEKKASFLFGDRIFRREADFPELLVG